MQRRRRFRAFATSAQMSRVRSLSSMMPRNTCAMVRSSAPGSWSESDPPGESRIPLGARGQVSNVEFRRLKVMTVSTARKPPSNEIVTMKTGGVDTRANWGDMSMDEPGSSKSTGRPRFQRMALSLGRWAWRGLVVLAVVGVWNRMTLRVEGVRSFGETKCQVRLVRSYNNYGIFEVTRRSFLRFGRMALEPGQSINQFVTD